MMAVKCCNINPFIFHIVSLNTYYKYIPSYPSAGDTILVGVSQNVDLCTKMAK